MRGDMEKITHRHPMLDPENSLDEEGIRDFDGRLKTFFGKDDRFDYTVAPKIDGVSVEIIYEMGRLILASTRGDGYVGEDITPNIKTLLSVPLTLHRFSDGLPIPDLLEVRGEVYIEREAFNLLNDERARKGLSVFATQKDASDGFLRNRDLRITARSPLTMFCSRIGELKGPLFQTQMELMIGLQEWGVRVNRPHIRVYDRLDDVIEYCHFLEANRAQFPFDIDGVMIQVNQRDLQSRLGQGSRSPGWALTYKFNLV